MTDAQSGDEGLEGVSGERQSDVMDGRRGGLAE